MMNDGKYNIYMRLGTGRHVDVYEESKELLEITTF